MATEMSPGVFQVVFARLAAKSRATGVAALTSIALAIEREAKLNLGRSTHRYGTPSPARPGGPPALVSGTLRRSITHTRPAPTVAGWEVRVGVAAGFYPPYPRKGTRTSSSKYGYYLETGQLNRGGLHGPSAAYPFLLPAFHKATAGGASGPLGRVIAADWAAT